ncbi:Glycosyltransferase [Quillaja saponaria]|uniref:Glycosyltransferase n=1 Tax=Quillaja saponaria TaxID=32244 RepID=A0AAD7PPN6_QUISA|nr:Glycosyltransferase [Quillaja saponaria]
MADNQASRKTYYERQSFHQQTQLPYDPVTFNFFTCNSAYQYLQVFYKASLQPVAHSSTDRHTIFAFMIATFLSYLQIKSTGQDDLSPFKVNPVTTMTSIISLLFYYLAFGAKLKYAAHAPQKLDIVMDVFGSLSMASLVSLLLPKSWWFIRYCLYVILLVGDLHQLLKILNDRHVHGILHRQPQPPPLFPETFTDVISNTEISRFLLSSPIHNQLSDRYTVTTRSSSLISQRLSLISSPTTSFVLLSFIIVLGVFLRWVDVPVGLSSSNKPVITEWHDYTLKQAASFVARNGTVIVCAVSQPSLLFLNNWLISVAQQNHQDKKAASLLQILDLGYNVMYNDVDMVWLADPFPLLQGNHDVYFTDDMAAVSLQGLTLLQSCVS